MKLSIISSRVSVITKDVRKIILIDGPTSGKQYKEEPACIIRKYFAFLWQETVVMVTCDFS